MSIQRILITGGSGFIGTNLISEIQTRPGVSVANLDIAEPKMKAQRHLWRFCDVRDGFNLEKLIREFDPDAIVHLAARTDLDGRTSSDYSTNTDGIARLLEALTSVDFVGPAVFASSMYVCRPGYAPTSDTDFQPHTAYGESKVVGEQLIRAANPRFPWVIVRPTSIWGPWFGIPYIDFFNMVLAKRYVNIANNDTRKTYGYVGNTVAQILTILNNAEIVRSKAIYLGDGPAYVINEWADEIADFVPYRVARVPRLMLKALAIIGDIGGLLRVPFPMSSFRLRNLTTDNVHDLRPIEGLMGRTLPYTRQQGNTITVDWLRRKHQSIERRELAS